VNATLEDLKLESGYMLVRGKGDKERIVPLGKPAQDALSEYLAQGRHVLADRKFKNPHPFDKLRAGSVPPRTGGTRMGHPGAGVADGGRCVGCIRTACVAAHAASLVRDAHGGKWR
jgi:integrase